VRRRRTTPVLITDAQESPERERFGREVRYLIMMSMRAVCLIVAAILVSTKPPLLGLWLSLCIAGMVLLPWAAVILANDRAPKPQYRAANWLRRKEAPAPVPPRAVAAPPDPRVIDADD
jgi:Protein of unknown function (DUF3099)